MAIPFVDLKAQYQSIKVPIDLAIQQTLDQSHFIGGQEIKAFESAFSEYLNIGHCIACANGTDAIEMALLALGVGPGDEVIVPANSWISTAEAVNNVGAEPVFVDVIEREYNMDPDLIEDAITDQTRVIIPVHLYGLPARMPAIMAIAQKYGLQVIEDCAQAHGALIGNKMVGTYGEMATFSFYPGKNLGAYGDAGAVVTNDEGLAQKLRMIGNHGQLKKHDHRLLGRNSRMDTMQAAILGVKLPYLEHWITRRNEVALAYRKYLKEEVICQRVPETFRHVYHLQVIRTRNREVLMRKLDELEIGYGIHYPTPLPFVKAYLYKGYEHEHFPVAHRLSSQIISLPIFPEMTDEQVKLVADVVNKVG